MRNRLKMLASMVKEAELELVRHYTKTHLYCVDVRAANGVEGTFALPTREGDLRGDLRGDLNARSEIRRFARQNPAPDTVPEPEKRPILTLKKDPQPASDAARELTPIEFYRLCEWTKAQATANWFLLPDFASATHTASHALNVPLTEACLREAMTATGTAEPDEWQAMPEPHVVLARELAAIMKGLGVEPTRHFARLMETLG